MKPIGAPFPGIAGYREEAECIGRKSVDGRDTRESVFGGIGEREFALPDVAEVLPGGRQLVSPRIEVLFEAAARGEFPFRLGREAFAGPGGVLMRVGP